MLLIACAAQSPPRPPRLGRPEQITDLAVVQHGETFEFSFTLPELTVEGERLRKPVEIEIFRSTSKAPASLEQMLESRPWIKLTPEELASHSHGKKVVFPAGIKDSSPPQGSTFRFMVRAFTRGFRGRAIESDPSNVVSAKLIDVSPPVQNLKLRPTQQAIELQWSAPTSTLAGRPPKSLSGYRVYRSMTGKPGSFELLAETEGPAYPDSDFQFGNTYFYKVRALFTEGGQTAETDDSLVATITPRDVFPPAPPTNLGAVYAANEVELIWNANTEPDLAGYNVYRNEPGGKPQKINAGPVRTPVCRDATVQPGHTYVYRITALDLAGNESTPSPEVSVETR